MSDFTITIVGTGVIGTSLGLALKRQADPPRLIGHDKDLTIAQQGVKLGAFDKADWNLVNACEPADLIVLALPLNGVRPTLEAIAPYLKPGAVITDTDVSKQAVLNWATEILPDTAQFVGGNPLVHPAGSGPQHATAALFQDKQYCLTPSANANEEAVQLVAGLVSLVGAVPYFLDAAEHDSLIVSVEQLPALLGVALVRTLSAGGSWREIRKLAGGRFEQTTTGAEGDPDGIAQNFLENRERLIHWLDRYSAELRHLRDRLAAEGDDAAELLAQDVDAAVVERRNWLADFEASNFVDPELTANARAEIPGFWQRWVGFGGFRKRDSGDKK